MSSKISSASNRSSRSRKPEEWTSTNYSINKGFPIGTDYLRSNLIFNSPLALNGPLFKPIEDKISYKKYIPSSINMPPIPGNFPYDKDWSAWGGDSEYLVGDSYYTAFMTGFGMVGVMATQAYYSSGGKNKIAKHKLRRLGEGSRMILNWFANLVDGKGNSIPANGSLKKMMSMMINGDQPIQLKDMYSQLDKFIGKNEDVRYYLTSLKKYLSEVLFDRIEVLPWQELIKRRQKGMLYMYQWFETYKSNPGKYDLQINEYIQDFIDTANQMAAFFGIFIHLEMMFDTMLDTMKHGEFVIPPEKRHQIMNNITNQLLPLLMLNTIMYRDLAELYTRKDIDVNLILQAEITQIDYCDQLSSLLGLVFAIFDALIRGRKLYDAM